MKTRDHTCSGPGHGADPCRRVIARTSDRGIPHPLESEPAGSLAAPGLTPPGLVVHEGRM